MALPSTSSSPVNPSPASGDATRRGSASPAKEPTHGCVRCGRQIPIDVALCEDCNPLGLKQPSPTQVHAIAAGGIVLFVLFLAVVGRLALRDVGPFSGEVRSVVATPSGLEVTLAVTNAGSSASATTCRVIEASRPVGGPGQLLQTPNVPGGSTIEFTAPVSLFGDQPLALTVDCQSP
jgi:hypothetical protein